MLRPKINNLLKYGTLSNVDTQKVSYNSYSNLFDVVNKGENSYFNLCKGINFNNNSFIDSSLYTLYQIQENDCWTNISYKFYNTIELWWLICKFNNIENPFLELEAGKTIKIPNDEIKETILEAINTI